jgi:hypothetical protein
MAIETADQEGHALYYKQTFPQTYRTLLLEPSFMRILAF